MSSTAFSNVCTIFDNSTDGAAAFPFYILPTDSVT